MSSYYVSRKSFSVWISIIFAILTVFAGTLFIMSERAVGVSAYKMTGVAALPLSAAVFVLFVLIFGKRRFGITILPVIMGCLSLIIVSVGDSTASILLCRSVSAIAGLTYLLVVFNKVKTNTLLVYILGLTALNSLITIYISRSDISVQDIAAFSATISMFFLTVAMRREYEGHILKWNDRAYGRRVRSMPPMSQITPYFMPDRIGAQNLIREELELSSIEEYIAKKRKEGLKGFGFMHVFITAYLRVVAEYPAVNRFLSGQRVFSRFKCIICFVIKKEMTVDAPDTVVKAEFTPGISSNEVYEKISALVSENKGEADDSTFDSVAKYLNYIPGLVLKFVVWFFKLLDYFGLLPTALEDVSPFHGSMFFTSMASLGIPVIFHHLYNFGNVPIFCAFGKKYKRNEIEDDGSIVTKKYMDYTVSSDERICDGFYYSLVFREFKRILQNPDMLDETVEAKKDII
ncbi:MAG: hypothetical protein WCX81_07565 [Monoglobales bacterium]